MSFDYLSNLVHFIFRHTTTRKRKVGNLLRASRQAIYRVDGVLGGVLGNICVDGADGIEPCLSNELSYRQAVFGTDFFNFFGPSGLAIG